jgi:hypothetical protein
MGLCVLRRTYRQDYETLFDVVILSKHHYIGIQGNMDPMVLFAPKDVIKSRVEEILREGACKIMNDDDTDIDDDGDDDNDSDGDDNDDDDDNNDSDDDE